MTKQDKFKQKTGEMKTECTPKRVNLKALSNKQTVVDFEGGNITSDAGLLLLKEIENTFKIIEQFTDCFKDLRDSRYCKHTLYQLIAQRIYSLCAGYEDLNDHDHLRQDSLYALLVEKSDPKAEKIAGKSTLNRLELTPEDASPVSRYKKIVYYDNKIEDLLVDIFLQAFTEAPASIILDLDATDDPIHGNQEGRFFHGYYGNYCYLPLYITCNGFVLCSKLRQSNIDASYGSIEELSRIIGKIRQQWPLVNITIRGDSGFSREGIYKWCEENEIDYVIGIARNNRLVENINEELLQAEKKYEETKCETRIFKEFAYEPLKKAWSKKRRIIGKAEHLKRGSNPRFIVTTLQYDPKAIYEDYYCPRGDMENRIKEQQLSMFADRTSAETMRANQLRLWFSTLAYTFMHILRHEGLKGSGLEKIQCETMRTRLLKIGAHIKISVRRVFISISEGFGLKKVFLQIVTNLKMRHEQEELMNC